MSQPGVSLPLTPVQARHLWELQAEVAKAEERLAVYFTAVCAGQHVEGATLLGVTGESALVTLADRA